MYQYIYLFIIITSSHCYHGSMNLIGKLECNGKPWRNETVSIYESNFILPDSLLNSNQTDENGNFHISASGDDLYPIRPYLYLPNYCNAEVFLDKEWARYLRIRVPDFYIDKQQADYNGKSSETLMDFGTIELSDMSSEQIGFQKFTDLIRNFAESRWVVKKIERKLKMSEI